jgi:hypothetical protein
MVQEIRQDEVEARVLEGLFDLANKSDGRATGAGLAKALDLPVLRVELALGRLQQRKSIKSEYDDYYFYMITDAGYREVEDKRLAPGHSADIPIPASDRIVTLGDNQKGELERSTSDLFDELGRTNAVDGDEALRERFLAQLSAARELVRAQSIRAYLFYQLVVEVLSKLIRTYGKTALGVAAAKLLELYVEYLVKG